MAQTQLSGPAAACVKQQICKAQPCRSTVLDWAMLVKEADSAASKMALANARRRGG